MRFDRALALRALPWLLVILTVLVVAFLIYRNDTLRTALDGSRQTAWSASQETKSLKDKVGSLQLSLDAAAKKIQTIQQSTSTQPESDTGASRKELVDNLAKSFGIPKQQLVQGQDPESPDFGNKGALVGYAAGSLFKLLYKISNHAEDGWLLVYQASDAMQLVYLDETTKQGYVVANSKEVSYTGNSGGLWFPVAFTKDDKKLVMCAMMGDPGAGGSNVSYGCELLSLKPLDGREFYLWQTTESLPGLIVDPRFSYDQMGKTIYTAQGEKTPHHSQPGPSTASVIMYRDLTTGKAKKLLEETDTTYDLKSLDEKAGTLNFEATKYRYPTGCQRGDGGIMDEALDCAEIASTSTRALKLP
jgi:hypothetical protein